MDKAPEAFRTISEVADELEVPKHVLALLGSKIRPAEADEAWRRPALLPARGRGPAARHPFSALQRRLHHQGRAEDPARAGASLRDGPASPSPRSRSKTAACHRAREIPDVAAEAAQSRGFRKPPGVAEQASRTVDAEGARCGAQGDRGLPPDPDRAPKADTAVVRQNGLFHRLERVYPSARASTASERSAARLAHRSGGSGTIVFLVFCCTLQSLLILSFHAL